MASKKRMHFSESSNTASSESDEEYVQYPQSALVHRKTRTPKSQSRNALMARENRLRKKLYLEKLESLLNKEKVKNKKLSNMLESQATVIQNQEREIKYMKSVLANNGDIAKLLRNIHNNTGFPVGTSLNKNLTIKNERERIEANELHPWSDELLEGLNTTPLSDFDYDLASLDLPFLETDCFASASPTSSLDDHTYTAFSSDDQKDSLGICLHISNHKVSLEYCSICHENSNKLWSEEDEVTN